MHNGIFPHCPSAMPAAATQGRARPLHKAGLHMDGCGTDAVPAFLTEAEATQALIQQMLCEDIENDELAPGPSGSINSDVDPPRNTIKNYCGDSPP